MSIVHKLIKGIVYVYEKVSYWDKEKKQPRSKWKLLGKLDEATGTIVSTARNHSISALNPQTPRIPVPRDQNNHPALSGKHTEESAQKHPPQEGEGAVMITTITGHDAHEEYIKGRGGKAVDALHKTSTRRMRAMEVLDSEGIRKEGVLTVDGIEIRLCNWGRVNMNVHARRLLDLVLAKITAQVPYGEAATRYAIVDTFEVKVTLKEFMKMFGLSDKKNAREQFRAAGECLISLSLKFDYEIYKGTGRSRKAVKEHFSYYLLEGTTEMRTLEKDPVVNSEITFTFSVKVLEYLCTRNILPLNIKLFRLNPHTNPHAYGIGRKLMEHYNANAYKGEPVRLSVRCLLPHCPELPTVEELRETGNREYWQKIYEPVQRDLDALEECGIIASYHYCHSYGIPLTEEELATFTFEDWTEFLIEFTLPDYPIQEERRRKYMARKRMRAAK